MVDVRNLKNGAAINVVRSVSVDIPAAFGCVEKTVCVSVVAVIVNNNGIYALAGTGSAEITLSCALCLAPVRVTVDFEIDEVFSEGELFDEGVNGIDCFPVFGKQIDITPAVESCFFSAIPPKVLCEDEI